jgi:hypothetical protein
VPRRQELIGALLAIAVIYSRNDAPTEVAWPAYLTVSLHNRMLLWARLLALVQAHDAVA